MLHAPCPHSERPCRAKVPYALDGTAVPRLRCKPGVLTAPEAQVSWCSSHSPRVWRLHAAGLVRALPARLVIGVQSAYTVEARNMMRPEHVPLTCAETVAGMSTTAMRKRLKASQSLLIPTVPYSSRSLGFLYREHASLRFQHGYSRCDDSPWIRSESLPDTYSGVVTAQSLTGFSNDRQVRAPESWDACGV